MITSTKKAKTALDLNREQEEELQEEVQGIYQLMQSPATDMLSSVLIAGKENLPNYEANRKAINNKISNKVQYNGKQCRITRESPKNEEKLELFWVDVDNLAKDNTTAIKLLSLIFHYIGEKALDRNGQLKKSEITFSLADLVKLKMYKNVKSAENSLDPIMDTLTSFSFKGTFKYHRGKRELLSIQKRNPFEGYDLNGGQCTVHLSSKFDWRLFTSFYISLPRWYFSLKPKATALTYTICKLCRRYQNKTINISFRSIQRELCLPDESSTKNPGRIRKTIESAIEEIEEANRKNPCGYPFQLAPHFAEGNIKNYLDNSTLTVTIGGEPAETLQRIKGNQQKKITRAAQRKERREDKAKAMNLAKTLAAEKH